MLNINAKPQEQKIYFLTYQPSNCLNFSWHRSDRQFSFPEWKRSQISLVRCVSHTTAPQMPTPLCRLAQADTCHKAILPLYGMGTGRTLGKVARRVTAQMGHLKGLRIEDQVDPTQSSGLQAHDHTCPSLSPLASVLPHPPPTTRNGNHGFSHNIANMQSFLWLLKKSNNLKK